MIFLPCSLWMTKHSGWCKMLVFYTRLPWHMQVRAFPSEIVGGLAVGGHHTRVVSPVIIEMPAETILGESVASA